MFELDVIAFLQLKIMHKCRHAMIECHLFLDRPFCFGVLMFRRFILRQSVVGWIPICAAVAFRFQLFFRNVSRMNSFSTVSRERVSSRVLGGTVLFFRSKLLIRFSGRFSILMRLSLHTTVAYSMIFSSSRTFPGKL